jgi:hypothetical protein
VQLTLENSLTSKFAFTSYILHAKIDTITRCKSEVALRQYRICGSASSKMSTNDLEKLFESFSLKLGQKYLAPSEEKKLADEFQRQLNLDFDVCAALAREFATVKIRRLNNNSKNSVEISCQQFVYPNPLGSRGEKIATSS